MTINDIDLQEFTPQFFKKQLRLQGRSISWLADNMGFCYEHTRRLLSNKGTLNETNKKLMIELLEIQLPPKKLNPVK